MKWLINLLKKMKAEKVNKEICMLESGEYDNIIKNEEILSRARAKQNKIKQLKNQNKPAREYSEQSTPEPTKKKKLTIGY